MHQKGLKMQNLKQNAEQNKNISRNLITKWIKGIKMHPQYKR